MKPVRLTAAAFAFVVLVTASFYYRAYGFPIPIPGVDPQSIAINAAARQMAPFIAAKAPVILDWNAVFPTVQLLPGRPFSPITGAVANTRRTDLERQLAHSTTGVVNMPTGDYALQIRVYCTDIHRHAGHQALWLMGPLRGARANVLAAMYARASGKDIAFHDLQSLSWALQAGMRYDELGTAQRNLANQLIPDFRGQIAGSFLDQVQGQWGRVSSTIPGAPSLDSALGRMGDAGQTVINIRYARDTILANANNYDALSRALAPPGGSSQDSNVGDPPWSIATERVYMRILTPGNFGSTSVVQIRVLQGLGLARVPFTSVISYPPNHHDWQPLTQESPVLSFVAAGVVGKR